MEQSVIVAYNKYKKHLLDKDSDIKNFKVAFFDYIIKIANYLFNNFDEFLWNTYSNAIARTVFNVLSGNPVKGEVKKALTNTKDNNDVNLPEEFSSILKKFAKRLTSFPHFNDLCNEQIQSGLMQNLIIALRNEKECSEIIEKIIGFYESNPLDMTDMDNTPFVRLLEVVLSVSSKTELKRIYKLAIKEKLVELAKSKYGNFVVQKLITHCNSKKLFGKIFAKIENEMESILEIGNSGVLLAVVKACRNLEICQGGCMMVSFS